MKVYLDIETSFGGEITIVGIFRPPDRLVQLVGEEVNWTNLWNVLEGVTEILTYNGSRFDLPVIKRVVGLDLNKYFECRDLMYHCWEKNLYGGLKRVEEQLGIERASKGIDGLEAMRLWERFRIYGDEKALQALLEYNRDDVINLYHLEAHLERLAAENEKMIDVL
ncbi:MAG: ribonuclease H-like domain-containing protein [Deltaproteobacteria bacterium]|nr:ribonuclease H-like domain-containing protein [Deltaproteobacteria bacterium]